MKPTDYNGWPLELGEVRPKIGDLIFADAELLRNRGGHASWCGPMTVVEISCGCVWFGPNGGARGDTLQGAPRGSLRSSATHDGLILNYKQSERDGYALERLPLASSEPPDGARGWQLVYFDQNKHTASATAPLPPALSVAAARGALATALGAMRDGEAPSWDWLIARAGDIRIQLSAEIRRADEQRVNMAHVLGVDLRAPWHELQKAAHNLRKDRVENVWKEARASLADALDEPPTLENEPPEWAWLAMRASSVRAQAKLNLRERRERMAEALALGDDSDWQELAEAAERYRLQMGVNADRINVLEIKLNTAETLEKQLREDAVAHTRLMREQTDVVDTLRAEHETWKQRAETAETAQRRMKESLAAALNGDSRVRWSAMLELVQRNMRIARRASPSVSAVAGPRIGGEPPPPAMWMQWQSSIGEEGIVTSLSCDPAKRIWRVVVPTGDVDYIWRKGRCIWQRAEEQAPK